MATAGIVAIRPDEVTWDRALRLFALRCRSLNLSEGTQNLYAIRLRLWREWLQQHDDPQPAQVQAETIRAHFEDMRRRGWKDDTLDSAYRILKTLFRWLEREELITANPMNKVERPRREKRLVRPFSPAQLRAFLGAINPKTAIGARDFAFCVLLADTGLRVGEAIGLRCEDLDFGEGAARVLGKGRKERMIPLGQTVTRAIIEWLKVRAEIAGMDRLFCNRFGQPMKKRAVLEAFHRIGDRAGITGVRVSPHTLRHTFAVSYLRNGGDVLTLQKILGHATLEMTRRYAEMADVDVIERHRQASPLDRLGPLPNERRRVLLR